MSVLKLKCPYFPKAIINSYVEASYVTTLSQYSKNVLLFLNYGFLSRNRIGFMQFIYT